MPALLLLVGVCATLAHDALVFRGTSDGHLDSVIADAADDHDLDPFILKALLYNESKLNPNMKSRFGVGVGSFTPAGVRGVNWLRERGIGPSGHSFERFTIQDAMDPQKAVPAVAEYLSYGIKHFGRDGGLAFYHCGFLHGRAVKKFGYWGAKGRGILSRCGSVRMSGRYVLNILKRANALRTQAGLQPLEPPKKVVSSQR